MNNRKKILLLLSLIIVAVVFGSPKATALSLLFTSDNYWFDPADSTPVDANIEMTGLKLSQVKALLASDAASLAALKKKLKIKKIAGIYGKKNVLIEAKGVSHKDLVALRKFCDLLKGAGGVSAQAELPFVPRILNIDRTPEMLKFAQSVSGVRMSDLVKITKAEKKAAGKPLVFRYNIEKLNQEAVFAREDAQELARVYVKDKVVLGLLPTGLIGRMPVMIDGESAMFHHREYHGNSIVAKHNPGLLNRLLQHAMDNKYWEWLLE